MTRAGAPVNRVYLGEGCGFARVRTEDLSIKNRVLYQLSYETRPNPKVRMVLDNLVVLLFDHVDIPGRQTPARVDDQS